MPDQNKSEKATPHKRLEQKKKGNVFQSKDLINGLLILISFTSLRFLAGWMFGRFHSVLNNFINLGSSVHTMDAVLVSNILFELVTNLLLLVLPILSIVMIFGVVLSMSQTRIAFTSELIRFKFSRINPIEGIKKMFTIKALVELIKSILKITIIIIVLYWAINSRIEQIPGLLKLDIANGMRWIGETVFTVALYAGVAMAILGILDFIYQWWEHERSLMMSKQEIRDEYKQLEGDPMIKGKRSQIREQRARERMMSAVKDADVVVRNPEHFAVAIRYKIETDDFPVVVAKGKDLMASRIIAEAEKHGVHTMENPPLARALFASVDLDMPIPMQFWHAVGDIILHIMSMRGQSLDKIDADITKKRGSRPVPNLINRE